MKARTTRPNPEPQRLTDGFGFTWDVDASLFNFDVAALNWDFDLSFDVPGDFDFPDITFDVPDDFELPTLNWDVQL